VAEKLAVVEALEEGALPAARTTFAIALVELPAGHGVAPTLSAPWLTSRR
jgi:hypothetical protein